MQSRMALISFGSWLVKQDSYYECTCVFKSANVLINYTIIPFRANCTVPQLSSLAFVKNLSSPNKALIGVSSYLLFSRILNLIANICAFVADGV